MTDTYKKTAVSPAVIVHRTAVPFFLFAAVFTALLAVSKWSILPILLSVEIAGDIRNVQDLKSYHDVLQLQIEKKQTQRNKLILPMEGTEYRSLADWKQQQYDVGFIFSSLSQLAKAIPATEAGPAVFIESIRHFPIDNLVEIQGDIRNVGPRSMTVLAQFVENIEKESFVQNVQHPTFRRVENAELGFISPFQLTITLQ